MLRVFCTQKIIKPLKRFLKQGLSYKELALTIAIGVTIGTMPVLGVTTILCALAAIVLRLNLPVIQFANYLAYPLQIVLLVPFYYLGDLFFGARVNLRFDSLKDVLTGIKHKETVTMLLDSTLNAVGAWLLISPLVLILLYNALEPVLVRINSRSSRLKFIQR
ncbi:MAG: DUF2062 domain-containing protein [Desulfobacterales bacterium]|jgi:uncharacterized protein (DUF2062 family)